MINFEYFKYICDPLGADPCLIYAIAKVESALRPNAVRYEPNWKYWYKTDEFAKSLHITRDTEKVFQATSWGLMQIMGTVARELGFIDYLTELTIPRNNILLGFRKLEELSQKYEKLEDVISSYNQGYPKKDEDGNYCNHKYVNSVMTVFNSLK